LNLKHSEIHGKSFNIIYQKCLKHSIFWNETLDIFSCSSKYQLTTDQRVEQQT